MQKVVIGLGKRSVLVNLMVWFIDRLVFMVGVLATK